MDYMNSVNGVKVAWGDVFPYPIYDGMAMILAESQFFPAKDGTWLMVDYMPETGNWYVTEGI